LAIALFFSAQAVWNAGERYGQGRQQWNLGFKQADSLKQRYRQLIHREADLKKLRNFVDQAKAVGLVKDRWAYYPIAIDEAVTFSVAEEVLNQTWSSGAYYFKPKQLHLKKNIDRNDADNESTGRTEKDLLLTLKGSFVVRKNDR
jgi:hypothetical protein